MPSTVQRVASLYERHADADFGCAATGHVRHHAVDPQAGEQECEQSEEQDDDKIENRACRGFR